MAAGEKLFLPPDETPAGKSRKAQIDEMKKDWGRLKEAKKSAPKFEFKDVKKLVRATMVLQAGPGPAGSNQMEFTVGLTDEGWRIVSMEAKREK